jgi:hypothetical protein
MVVRPIARRTLSVAALVVVLAGALGCGSKQTDVTGKVTYKGKSLVAGNVTLVSASGTSHSGAISSDGTYTIPGVPLGPVKIGVTSTDPGTSPAAAGRVSGRDSRSSAEKAGAAKAPAPVAGEKVAGWFPIPTTVMDPNKSNLTGSAEPDKPLNIDIP